MKQETLWNLSKILMNKIMTTTKSQVKSVSLIPLCLELRIICNLTMHLNNLYRIVDNTGAVFVTWHGIQIAQNQRTTILSFSQTSQSQKRLHVWRFIQQYSSHPLVLQESDVYVESKLVYTSGTSLGTSQTLAASHNAAYITARG